MTTVSIKILTTFAVAAAIAVGLFAVPSTADARTYRHHYYSYRHYRPYAFYPRYYGYGYPRYYGYGGAYAYQPAYPRVPVYNHDDATKLSRQLMGLGD